jgi:hypothetical protein
MDDFQQILQVVPPTPVVEFPSQPLVVNCPPLVLPFVNPPLPPPVYVAPVHNPTIILPARPQGLTTPVSVPPVGTKPSGQILPNITYQNNEQPYFIPYYYLSSLQKQDPLTVSTLNAGVINVSTLNSISTFALNISTNYIEATEAYVNDKLTLDNQVLTADATSLLLNGIPLVTTANLSSLSDWSLDPAISTIQADGNDLTNVRFANFSSIIADGLTVVKLTTLFSTTIEIFESTITSETQKLTVSSINGGHAFFDFLTANSVINPANSTINCDFLNVASNANFSNGATFTGTRPNFNTGINTSGANNFNNTNLDNCGQINAGALSLFGSATISELVDSGGSILTNSAITLATQNGGSSVINIEARRNALLAYPVPLSQVNIVAEGNCPNIPVVPLTPYGGAVNISANAGQDPIFPLTALTNAFAPGAIHLTAYSKQLFPGLITEAAGSILAYSGLTNPTAGLYGCSFYSALTCLSLSAGLSPALTSFPGTVFLRGDNGTKVVNGFYADNIYNNAGGNLNIATQGGYWVDINNTQALRMGNSALIDGGGGTTSIIQNFYNINGSNVNTPQLNVNNISTGAITLPQLYTSFINIAPSNTVYISAPDLTINANVVTDEAEDPLPNNLNLLASANINITIPNNNAYSINMSGSAYISKNLYVTSNIQAATFNGAPIPPPYTLPNDITVSSINAPLAQFSSINASTLTLSAIENISFNANVPLPTFLTTGNIAMNAEKDIDLMANIGLTVGAGNDIDITASSTITMTAQETKFFGGVKMHSNLNMNGFSINNLSSISGNSNLRILGTVFTSNASNWTNGSVNTLYGSEVLSGKYIQWSYDNNPGTGIYDNCNIKLDAPTIHAQTAVIGTPSAYGNTFAYFGNNSLASNGGDYALLQENNGRTFLNAKLYEPLYLRNGNYDIMILNDTQIQAFKPLNMCNNSISNINDLDFNNGAYIDGAYSNQLNFNASNSYFLGDLRFYGSNRVLDLAYNDIYEVKDLYIKGNLIFQSTSTYIADLGHIYGNTAASGGGLAIDYMYGMFFNSPGKNAGIYIDSGNLNMINYNSGINIANYNSNGTGNLTLYSASNDLSIGTGTGRDINLNGGRYVSVNAAQPGGAFGIYASTINSTTLEDTNFTANRNMTLNSSSNININSVIDTNITAQKNMVLSASNSGNYITLNSGEVNRTLSGTSISQPVIQYNTISTSGSSGSQTVALPTPYTSGTSFVAFACMEDADPCEISVVRDNLSSITIHWQQAGGGSHTIAWNTMGL